MIEHMQGYLTEPLRAEAERKQKAGEPYDPFDPEAAHQWAQTKPGTVQYEAAKAATKVSEAAGQAA